MVDQCPSTHESLNPNPPEPGSGHINAFVALTFHGSPEEWTSYAESLSSDPLIRVVGATVRVGLSCGQCTASSSQPGTSSTATAPRIMHHFRHGSETHVESSTCEVWGCEPVEPPKPRMMRQVGVEGDLYNKHRENTRCKDLGCVPV